MPKAPTSPTDLFAEALDWGALGAKDVARGEKWILIRGDSSRILSLMPPASVAALVTDPPYSSGGFVRSDKTKETSAKYATTGSEQRRVVLSDFEGDNRDQLSFLAWARFWMWDARAVVRRGGLGFVFTDWRQLPAMSDAFQIGGWIWRGVFNWDKGASHRRAGYGRFSNRTEYGVWGSNGPMLYTIDPAVAAREKLDPSMLEGSFTFAATHSAKRNHVTQKPGELMRYIVRAVPRDEIILDPFCGVASTGIGAVAAGRRFVGIELDSDAFAFSAKRLQRFDEQLASRRKPRAHA